MAPEIRDSVVVSRPMAVTCTTPGCSAAPQSRYWDGKAVCGECYCRALQSGLEEEYALWAGGDAPAYRFRYLMARSVIEQGNIGLLTNAQIRDRSFDFRKTDNTECEFSIAREWYVWAKSHRMQRVVERFRFYLSQRRLVRIGLVTTEMGGSKC